MGADDGSKIVDSIAGKGRSIIRLVYDLYHWMGYPELYLFANY